MTTQLYITKPSTTTNPSHYMTQTSHPQINYIKIKIEAHRGITIRRSERRVPTAARRLVGLGRELILVGGWSAC